MEIDDLLNGIWEYECHKAKFTMNYHPNYILINRNSFDDLMRNENIHKYTNYWESVNQIKFMGIPFIRTFDIDGFEVI